MINNRNIKKINSFFVLIIIALFPILLSAQNKMSLPLAIEMAIKNNMTLKSERLKAEYHQKMIETYKNIPSTIISGGFGQMNSSYIDNRFAIGQSFSLPIVYSNQKKLLTEEWKSVLLGVNIKEVELKKMITELYYSLIYLKAKEKLLLKSDTIYNNFFKKTEVRFSKGESNILEKTTAETQLSNLRLQLKQLNQEIAFLQAKFQLLLNVETKIEVEESLFYQSVVMGQNTIEQHPNLKYIEQQKQLNTVNIALEKSKLLPEISVGAASTTMKGVGSDDIYYNRWKRFQSFDIGVGIPIFRKSQKAKIAANEFYGNVLNQELATEKQQLENHYQSLIFQYNASNEQIKSYEATVLPNANLIVDTATKQFNNGEINYLDWVILINQSIELKKNYIELVKVRNEYIVQLSYFNN
ncbi:MAG: TolC family protein [Saprospiraceae bacterium]|nr:TolC family protein [Saprospiraceae bacterium]